MQGVTAAGVLKNQAEQKRELALHLRGMAERHYSLAVELEAHAKSLEGSADRMVRIAEVEEMGEAVDSLDTFLEGSETV